MVVIPRGNAVAVLVALVAAMFVTLGMEYAHASLGTQEQEAPHCHDVLAGTAIFRPSGKSGDTSFDVALANSHMPAVVVVQSVGTGRMFHFPITASGSLHAEVPIPWKRRGYVRIGVVSKAAYLRTNLVRDAAIRMQFSMWFRLKGWEPPSMRICQVLAP